MSEKPVYFNPIRSKRTFDEISTEIKKMIVKGVFKPGDKLPAESEIARQFNVGRQTVREALRMLELSGFISIQKGGGGGAVITNTIINTISNSFLDAFQMKSISVKELTIARMEVEKLVISHVIDDCTDEDIDILNRNIEAAGNKINLGIQAFEENIGFHMLLARASKNGVFVIVVQSIMAIVAEFLSRIPQTLEISTRIWSEHKKMVEAIMRRDKNEAMVLMEDHLGFVDRRFNSSMEEMVRKNKI
ncbi:MAG: FadR/GntR family transcriptional regulator [Syntrophorhabdaceae bacterium]|nr:FadR family transcriptional regulator [Syntrophorhabdaceae bacterium]MDD4197067.1 FadR/GntR family transcriptional regulator [Syntrophorhabdaceae bacterium]